jgi:hypothetical protein
LALVPCRDPALIACLPPTGSPDGVPASGNMRTGSAAHGSRGSLLNPDAVAIGKTILEHPGHETLGSRRHRWRHRWAALGCCNGLDCRPALIATADPHAILGCGRFTWPFRHSGVSGTSRCRNRRCRHPRVGTMPHWYEQAKDPLCAQLHGTWERLRLRTPLPLWLKVAAAIKVRPHPRRLNA